MRRVQPALPFVAKTLGWLTACCVAMTTTVTTFYYLPVLEPDLALFSPHVATKITPAVLSAEAESDDGRAAIVAKFLERHKSPLVPYDHYGQVFVDIADRYSFDFRLLPAIAMQESNLCKSIPPETYNCLGFGIHKRGTLAFESYEANFERAGRELKANYINRGLTTPEQIMRKYTPSSNGSWADSVNQWMAEMRYDDRAAGRANTTDANVMEFAVPLAEPTISPQN